MVVVLVMAVLLPLVNAQYYVYQQQQQQYYPQQQQYYPQQQQQVQYYQQVPQQQQYYAPQQQQPQQPQVQVQAPQVEQQWYQQQPSQLPAAPTYQEEPHAPAPTYQEAGPSVQQPQEAYAPKIPHPEQAFDIPPPSTPSTRFIAASETKILTPGRRTLVNRPAHPRPIHTPSPTATHNTVRRPVPRGRTVSSVPRAPPPPAQAPVAPPAPAATPKPRTRPAVTPSSHLAGNKDPNAYFLSCCKTKKVAKTCESRCNFDNLSKKVLTGMFLGSDPCPQSDGLDLFSCAAQDGDHTPCCRRKNVMRTGAGDKCLNFCKMTPDAQFQADASYLPCWAVLNDIKACFKESIIDVIARQA